MTFSIKCSVSYMLYTCTCQIYYVKVGVASKLSFHAMLYTICSHACCMLWLIAVYVMWVTWEIVAAFLSTDRSMAWSRCMYLDVEVPPNTLWKPNFKILERKINEGISKHKNIDPSTCFIWKMSVHMSSNRFVFDLRVDTSNHENFVVVLLDIDRWMSPQ